MKYSNSIINPFNYHFFRVYIYHPFLFFFNCIRHPKKIIDLIIKINSKNTFNVYGFEITSPKNINKYFFANLNSKFNSFILEKYEFNEKKLVEKYLTEDDIVLELGGCIGVVSLLINRILNKKENHIVLEIDKNNLEYLKLNRENNHAHFNVINGVLSNNNNLYYQESHSFWGGKLVKEINSNPIQSYSLKQLELNSNLKFNTLVMDIEGGEVEVINEIDLSGFKKLLFEIHFERTSDQYITIEKILNHNNFTKIERYGRVECWERKY